LAGKLILAAVRPPPGLGACDAGVWPLGPPVVALGERLLRQPPLPQRVPARRVPRDTMCADLLPVAPQSPDMRRQAVLGKVLQTGSDLAVTGELCEAGAQDGAPHDEGSDTDEAEGGVIDAEHVYQRLGLDEDDIVEAFQCYDSDGAGRFSFAALRQCVHELEVPIEDAELRDMFEEADLDDDGYVNIREFVRIMSAG